MPIYTSIPSPAIVGYVKGIENALAPLDREGDKAQLRSGEDSVDFNMGFHMAPESIEELLTDKIISNTVDVIVRVKKPDYLGTSKWDVIHGGHIVEAKVLDEHWLEQFHRRAIDIRPGDALEMKMRIDVGYGSDGIQVSAYYTILEVKNVVRPDTRQQGEMFSDS